MFAALKTFTPDIADLNRVEGLVRERFDVAENDIVLVREEPGRQPGLPDRITTILFWIGPEARHKVRIFKPLAQVGEGDFPEGWLRGALLDEGEGDCC